MKVIRAILQGERNPVTLLELCDRQIQKKKAEAVVESLRGTWAPEHLFALRQALSAWEFYQTLLRECDHEIEKHLKEMAGPESPETPAEQAPEAKTVKKPKAAGKNAPQIADLHQLIVRISGGHDVTDLPGIADALALELISETGINLHAWQTERHFTSWCGLSPGTRQSGKRRSNVRRHRNRAGRLFCTAARTLVRSTDMALGGFYRRLAGRKGGLVAMKALARKLAQLYYRVLRHGLAYAEQGLRQYQQQYAETQRRLLDKLAKKHGFKLVSVEQPSNACVGLTE